MTGYIIEHMKYINDIYSFALLCFPVLRFMLINIDQQNELYQHHTINIYLISHIIAVTETSQS